MTSDNIVFLLAWAIIPLGILRFQIKSTRGYLAMHALVSALAGLTYFFQGSYSGAFVSLGTLCAVGIQAAIGHKLPLWQRIGVALPAIAMAIYFREAGWVALLPLVAFTGARLAEAIRHDLGLRVTMLGATSLWMSYAALSELPQLVIMEALGLVSNMIGIWRFHLRPAARQQP